MLYILIEDSTTTVGFVWAARASSPTIHIGKMRIYVEDDLSALRAHISDLNGS